MRVISGIRSLNPIHPRLPSPRWILFGLLLGLVIWAQAIRPLTDPTEARYAEVAREMLTSGDWVIPTLDALPHLTKPPLTAWLMAGSMALVGRNEMGARLPGMLALVATIFLVARLASLLGRPQASGRAAILFGLSMGPLAAAMYPSTDTLLTCFDVAAVAAYLAHGAGSRWARWGFFAALGLAFLTKGPPGLLVPAAVWIGDRWVRSDRTPRPGLGFLPGWILFGVIGCGWYILVALRRPETLQYWLQVEVAYRIFTNYHGRDQSPLIYLVALVGGIFPWWFLLPGFLRRGARLRQNWRRGGAPILLAWFALPLLVFVLSRSRLPAYMLPLVPAISLAMALDYSRAPATIQGRWFGFRPGWILAYAACLAGLSWISIPLAGRHSWKEQALQLRRGLSPEKYELVLTARGDAASLEYYLDATRMEFLTDGTGSVLPGVETVQYELEEWRTTDEAQMAHLFFARRQDTSMLQDFLQPASTRISEKHGHCLWLVPGRVTPAG